MARRLPWTTDSATRKGTTTDDARPAKRQRVLDPSSDDENVTPSRVSSTPKSRKATTRTARATSTSPVPSPPSEHSMRPGFDADDIYIMVEDEFQAIAQQYTAHLHRAEYERMKREARDANANTISDIARPTDDRTVMRGETKKRIEAQTMASKRGKAMMKMKEDLAKPVLSSEDEEAVVAEEVEKDADDDPWVGTSLQGLMTTGKKAHESLLGLEGLKSTTRAAAGFKKSGSSLGSQMVKQVQEIHDGETDEDSDAGVTNKMKQQPAPRSRLEPSSRLVKPDTGETRMQQDELIEVPSRREPPNKMMPTSSSARDRQVGKTNLSTPSKSERHDYGSKDAAKSTKPATRKRVFDDGFDDLDFEETSSPPKSSATAYTTKKSPSTNSRRSEMKTISSREEKKKKLQRDEIPLFL